MTRQQEVLNYLSTVPQATLDEIFIAQFPLLF